MINKTDVGHHIASLRKNLGLSQSEFAEKLSISTQAVSKWETGQSLSLGGASCRKKSA